MRKINKLLLGAATVLAPAVVAFSAFSCSTSQSSSSTGEQATKDRKTTYFLDTFVMPNLDYTTQGSAKALEQFKNDNTYSWTINEFDWTKKEFVTTGLGTLYIDESGKYSTDRQVYEIPALNFIGKDIIFVEDTTQAEQLKSASGQETQLQGHYEIQNAYVNWYFQNGKKINERADLGTIKIYGLNKTENILTQIQKFQKTWTVLLNKDIYAEFKEKINASNKQ